MHEDFPAGVIITGGLGGDACEGMLTTTFHLFCGIQVIVPVAPTIDLNKQGGGSRPLAPGEIKTFWKPVKNQVVTPEFYTPLDSVEIIPKNIVTVKMTVGSKTMKKEFIVGSRRLDVIVKVLNITKVGKEKVTATISNIRRVLHNAVVKIFNIRKKP